MKPDAEQLRRELEERGRALGFDLLRVTAAGQPPGYEPLLRWLELGLNADMEWMSARKDAYGHPDGILPGTRSLIVCAMNYYNGEQVDEAAPRFARYAWGAQDYHSVIRRQLKQLAGWLNETFPEHRTRVVVDTAPLLERDFGRLAGIGWLGKNTMLISREIGSWFFLGAILTTQELVADPAFETDHCGSCTRCLDACPTDAFPEAGVLDSNRCISYLTIERRTETISDELRGQLDNWIFGCDICQDVCPWNRFAPDAARPEFQRRTELESVSIRQLLMLDATKFDSMFAGTPLHRTGRDVIVRNACLAAANTGQSDCLDLLRQLRSDDSPLVSAAAIWAVERLSAGG